jgi:predicted unusual protein kinase regulating ubiquinone biosynthesis (AarF/ABC1/UbiB family)
LAATPLSSPLLNGFAVPDTVRLMPYPTDTPAPNQESLWSTLCFFWAALRQLDWHARRRLLYILWLSLSFVLPYVIRSLHAEQAHLPWWKRTFCRWLRYFKAVQATETDFHAGQAERLCGTFIKLGPTFIKIGQMLSTRTDLLPLTYAQALTVLQDEVPPFPTEVAWQRITEELGQPPQALFRRIEPRPLAAASLGQVHRAQLPDGTEVVVKIQRPNLADIIRTDFQILRVVAAYLERRPVWLAGVKGADWSSIVAEFEAMLGEEMDYEREMENAAQFRRNFATWQQEVYLPRIYPELSSRHIITMEYIPGVKPTDTERLRAAGFDPMQKITLLVRTYLKQLLEDGFFHADPHPGNLRIMADGRLAFFDFGMVGRITDEMRMGLLDAFFHITDRDLIGLVGDAIALGFLQPGYDPVAFQEAAKSILAKYQGKKLSQLTFSELNATVSTALYNYPFRIPGSFTFIVRALMTLEGMGQSLDPNFRLFEVARPHAKEFLLKRATAHVRDQLLAKLLRGEEVHIGWEKIWNVARLAYRTYFNPPPSTLPPGKTPSLPASSS